MAAMGRKKVVVAPRLLGLVSTFVIAAATTSSSASPSSPSSEALAADMLRLLRGLDWRQAYLISEEPRALAAALLRRGSGISWVRSPSDLSTDAVSLQMPLVYLAGPFFPPCRDELQQLVSLHRPPDRLLMVTDVGVDEDVVGQCLANETRARSLFVSDLQSWSLSRLLVFPGQKRVVRNLWPQDASTGKFREVYDLQGAEVSMLTLSWLPWLSIHDCDAEGRNCESRGILREVFDVLGDRFNFTYVVDREKNNDWGIVPSKGDIFDDDAEFSGVLGDTVYGKYEVSASLWAHTLGRDLWLDFTMSLVDRPFSVFVDPNQPLDWALFVRPFTPASWALVIALLTSALLALLCVSAVIRRTGQDRKKDSLISWRVLVLTTWILFILVNTYYGGALTMFFSSSPRLAFETLRQGLRLHPDWELVVAEGDQILINSLATSGDPDFMAQWDRMLNNREELLVANHKMALRKIQTQPGWFLYGSKFAIESAAQQENIHGLYEVSRETSLTGSLMFPKYSPLTAMFDRGVQRLRQTGTLDVVVQKWTSFVSSRTNLNKETLTARQTGVVFILYCLVISLCLAILAVEKVLAVILRGRKREENAAVEAGLMPRMPLQSGLQQQKAWP